MRRMYRCFTGQFKIVHRVGRGRLIKWRDDLPKGPSTVWYDEESDDNYTIPDNAWEVLSIPFLDFDDEGNAYERA